MVTWIGDIKKEIVFHGDVLNTSKRIQDECNKYDQSFMISECLLKKIDLPAYCKSTFIEELQLRGKKDKVYDLNLITELPD